MAAMEAIQANLDDTATLAPNSSDITALDSTQCRTRSCLVSSQSDMRGGHVRRPTGDAPWRAGSAGIY
jgi:hypothetical protein